MEMHADDVFSQSFDFASGATAERFQNPLWLITERFMGSKFRKSVSIVKDFGRRIVTNAVQDRKEQAAKDETAEPDDKVDHISGSLIQSLLDAIGDEETVADAALTYLSAGRDTTGQALTWTFYLLLQHPEAVTKIRAEVQDVLDQQTQQQLDSPSFISSSNPDPTLFTPQSLPYTTATFHEALRLYPPIPFEIRQAQADTTLPDGTFLPRHSVLVWCLWAMQRSRSTWGDDAEAFRPERFLVRNDDHQDQDQNQDQGQNQARDEPSEEKGNKKTWHFALGKSTSEFPVFYGGARACLGRKMAEAIAVQVIPSVVWGFDLEQGWEGPLEGRRSHTSMTLPMEGGLPVRVRRRVMG